MYYCKLQANKTTWRAKRSYYFIVRGILVCIGVATISETGEGESCFIT